MVLLQHLHVRVVRQASFTDRGEIGGFPTRAIQILFDLGRHDWKQVTRTRTRTKAKAEGVVKAQPWMRTLIMVGVGLGGSRETRRVMQDLIAD
jgi:hypothetical protein